MSNPFFTASVRENPGRRYLVVEFRHPLKNDANNHRGKKIRKGLGTADREEASMLVSQLNEILRDESLWSLGARPEAVLRGFDPRVLEIFYADVEASSENAISLREQALPLPARDSGYSRHLLIGTPGSGKSTLDRQLMGSHPDHEVFPPTSTNRTSTFPIETIFSAGEYTGVVTFLSEHETRFEIEESVSAAIIRASTDNNIGRTARDFLEQSDMRFRLKYILGDYQSEETSDDDPYATPETENGEVDAVLEAGERKNNSQKLAGFVNRIWMLTREYRANTENTLGDLDAMNARDRTDAFDMIQTDAECTDEYASIVSDILEELRDRFNSVKVGRFEKNTTGWPRLWRFDTNDRKDFFTALRFFAGNAKTRWGCLLTPLVNGIRVNGPFQPSWATAIPKLVLIDTEGLGHKADASADLPDHIVSMFDEVDSILLVHSARNAMDFSIGKALEALVSGGQTKKTIVVFTHMDELKGPNLHGQAKRDHAFNNLRNIIENQLAKSLRPEKIRSVTDHLEQNVYYLGMIDRAKPEPAYPELRRLSSRLENAAPKPRRVTAFPRYNTDLLVLKIREAAESFRLPWRARLGLGTHPQENRYSWQSIKAMTRRYAEGFDDGYPLRPASNLRNALSVAVSAFLEGPTSWDGVSTNDEKRDIIDHVKAAVSKSLTALSQRRLRKQPQPQWQTAYGYRGTGSALVRRESVESIYARWVPIPTGVGDPNAEEFLEDVKSKVVAGIDKVRTEAEAMRADNDAPQS